jgi:hypothetical protein
MSWIFGVRELNKKRDNIPLKRMCAGGPDMHGARPPCVRDLPACVRACVVGVHSECTTHSFIITTRIEALAGACVVTRIVLAAHSAVRAVVTISRTTVAEGAMVVVDFRTDVGIAASLVVAIWVA